MSTVEFHCSKCAKLIRAPSNKAGRRGKCPYCEQSVYIPTPPDELEEIPLAPMEEGGGEEELDEETSALMSDLEHAHDEPSEPGRADADAAGPGRVALDLHALVIEAVQALQESKLDRAESIIDALRKHGDRAKELVQAMMVDEMPPAELEDVPPKLYKGFLRNIAQQL